MDLKWLLHGGPGLSEVGCWGRPHIVCSCHLHFLHLILIIVAFLIGLSTGLIHVFDQELHLAGEAAIGLLVIESEGNEHVAWFVTHQWLGAWYISLLLEAL